MRRLRRIANQMFQQRGISLDTNLWPDYDLDLSLQTLLKSGMLKPGSIRRVAIVGPGLDFVNKQQGVDYYPPQTTQPFAVLDSLFRLGLANPTDRRALHSRHQFARQPSHRDSQKECGAGPAPIPCSCRGIRKAAGATTFAPSSRSTGRISARKSADPVDCHPRATRGFRLRNQSGRGSARCRERVKPIDMNIVFQRLPLSPDRRFDLIIGTNIFLYYGAFEQSLARANVAAMLKPGGFLLSNDKLA